MILKKLREILTKRNLSIFVLPRTDEHQSEYLCQCDERVAFLSGFTGSSGIAVVTQNEALVWTDSRYFVQAPKQLRAGWELKKMGTDPTWFQYIASKYAPPAATKPEQSPIVSIDGRLISAEVGHTRKTFLEEKGLKVEFLDHNLVDEIWDSWTDKTEGFVRPKNGASEIFVHEEWAGTTAADKINWVRKEITAKKGQGCLFSDLSEICWILNVRSSEIPYNPFMKSILVLRPEGEANTLFLPAHHPSLAHPSEELKAHLAKIHVQIKPYPFLPLPSHLLCRKQTLNYLIYSSLQNPIEWDGIGLYRARRTPKEQDGFRQAHIEDGAAMASFWAWRSKQESVGEYQAAMEMDQRRFKRKHNKGLSFNTISAGGPNAAVVHYHPEKATELTITKDMIHLLDSGGQYLNGTTDVTRTFHFGNPTPEQKDAYTRVLLGNLDIERLVWPKINKIDGGDIDVLARRRLWQNKMDYGHGTGHGVGHFEGVHEGPVGISKRVKTVFEPGMVVSNEPGYYEEGKFGIRIENLIMVVQDGNYLRFENLTLCPYDLNLIEKSLLIQDDIDHINKYHQRCWDVVSPLIQDEPEALAWLKHATRPL